MRKLLTTLSLSVLAALSVVAAVFLAHDGSLARLTGWYHFRPGMALFPEENLRHLSQVSWMRIRDLHDTIECERTEDGAWWIISPFRDRMSPTAAQLILSFTANAWLVDTLPLNSTTRASLREYGVETSPHSITLKKSDGDGGMTTVARYTLGSASPWLADAEDGEHLLPTSYLRTDFYGRDKRIHVVTGNILSIFKNGLEGLRDPHPLSFDQSRVLQFVIQKANGAEIEFSRLSAESPWNIVAPTLCEADQDRMEKLFDSLLRMRALRMDESDTVELPLEPEYTLIFTMDDETSVRLSLYKPFASPTDGQMLCYATVDNRPVVFTMPMEPKLRRKGMYSPLVNSILSLPVVPPKMQANIRAAVEWIYMSDIPLTLNELRSQKLSNITMRDVDRVLMRSRFHPYPVHLRRIPGNSDSDVEDIWMFSAEGRKYEEADPEVVEQLLNSMSNIPVAGFVKDFNPDEDIAAGMRRYGLNRPDYTLILQPRECAARAVIFGQDIPLVKDRAPRTFYMKRIHEPEDSYWIAMEQDMLSIYRLSSKMTRMFQFSPQAWKRRNLTRFPVSSLRSLSLYYQQAELVLHYDYIGESWTGTLNGEDISPRINPHRTNNYVRNIQKIKVVQWLNPQDEAALEALKAPVFTVRFALELTDYTALEALVVTGKKDEERRPEETNSMDMVTRMLTETDQIDRDYRDMALGEKKIKRETITIEIAPASSGGTHAFFYGRIRETGALFIIPFEVGLGLDGKLLD